MAPPSKTRPPEAASILRGSPQDLSTRVAYVNSFGTTRVSKLEFADVTSPSHGYGSHRRRDQPNRRSRHAAAYCTANLSRRADLQQRADGLLAVRAPDKTNRRVLPALCDHAGSHRPDCRRHLLFLRPLGIHLVGHQGAAAEVFRRLLEGRAAPGVLVTNARTIRRRLVHIALLGASNPHHGHDRPSGTIHHARRVGILLSVRARGRPAVTRLRAALPARQPG